MTTLYLDIFSGISGDMFLGAMIDLGVDPRALERELGKLKLDGWQIHVARGRKVNIDGLKFDVRLEGATTPQPNPGGDATRADAHAHSGPQEHEHEPPGHERGAHGGPLLPVPKGQVELSVFETNAPPRFRLYFYDAKGKISPPPAANNVNVETIRPNGTRQSFRFRRRDAYLEATDTLPEPHAFTAILKLKRGNRTEKLKTQFVEDHHHGHEHPHQGALRDGSPGHGRNFAEITALIQKSELSDWVKHKSVAVFHRVAVAEGKIHGQPPDQVHFHEVGAVDSIVDIVGACVALEMLGNPRVLAAPVIEGVGFIHCAHGRFPLPAPATLAILGARGIGVSQCDEPHELVTPTGAALLAEFAESFGPMQNLVAAKIGYGLGARDNKTRPNVLRAVLGEVPDGEPKISSSQPSTHDWETDTVAVIETNLDDISAEILGHFTEKALAEGALDVFHTPIQMKKNRPGVLLTLLCAAAEADKFSELVLRESTAFGVRRYTTERRKLRREFVTVKTEFGEVTVKVGKLNGKVVQAAPEFESCRKVAAQSGVPLKRIYEEAASQFRTMNRHSPNAYARP